MLTPSEAQHAGQGSLDQADALQGLDGGVGEVGVAGRQGERERIEDQCLRAQAVLVDGDIIDPSGHFQFALGGFGHALLRRWSGQMTAALYIFARFEDPIGLGAARLPGGWS